LTAAEKPKTVPAFECTPQLSSQLGDDFWQHNVWSGYRFPRRRAELRLGVLNLADQDYRLNSAKLICSRRDVETTYETPTASLFPESSGKSKIFV
jgi:hypothetical protein